MVRLFVRHQVVDYPAWRKAYDDFDGARQGLGVAGHAVYQSVGDPNDVTISHDFSTREAAESFVSSPQLRDTMEQAGVRPTPEIWFVTEA